MRTPLFLVAALAAAGCIDGAEPVGTVGVALTATDPTGATYRLTPGARLALSGGAYYDELSLDGDGAAVQLEVPTGDYFAELVHDAGYTTQWPLERTDVDGTVETVTATLITPMPATLTVTADAQVNLVLGFQVPDFGAITFSHGTVEVAIDVDETTAGGVDLVESATFDTTSVTVHPSAPPALATRMPALGDDVDMLLSAHATGDWYQASATSACAPAAVYAVGSGQAGVEDLLLESTTAEVQLCVFDSEPPQVQLLAFRAGAPTTPTFSDLGESNWLFVSYLTADLPAAVFDGETLDLDPVVGEVITPAIAYTRASVRHTGQPSEIWYRATYASDALYLRLDLTP